MKKVRLGIFISGAGSNAKKITEYFKDKSDIEVVRIISNNADSPLFKDPEIGTLVEYIPSEKMMKDDTFFERCKEDFDYIILAGYLKLIPTSLIHLFPHRIFNIHPALLPKYGGKGMYGKNVHKAVLANHEKQSGITIHFIDENYDEGQYLAQFYVSITNCTTTEEIAHEVQHLEHAYYASTIEQTIKLNSNS